MKTILSATLALTLLLTTSVALADREVEDYSETINMFKENATVASFFGSAYGYAVFPTIGKGGLGIGAAHGDGQVYRGGAVTGFTSYTDVSIGFQAGGQAYSQVVFFENQAAYDNFTSGNFEFDAGASAVAITASAEAGTSTTGTSAGAGAGGPGAQVEAGYTSGMLVFTVAKGGLMYEASLGGQKYGYEPVE